MRASLPIYEIVKDLSDIFFPSTLIGDLPIFHVDEYGIIERVNKDLGPEDRGYVPNTIVDISPQKQFDIAKEYFEYNFFKPIAKKRIFEMLDHKLMLFNEKTLESFISWDKNKIELKDVEKDLEDRKKQLIENYILIKNEELNEASPSEEKIERNPQFKTKYTVHELAYFFRLLIDQKIIDLDENQKSIFFKFIVANFQSKSKKVKKISLSSFRNKFYNLSPDVIEKVHTDLIQLGQRAKKDLDKE